MGAPGAAAEGLLAAARHLHRLADRGDQVARGRQHIVVTRQVAGVVVGDGEALIVLRGQPPLGDQPRQNLGMVDHLVMAAEVRVLVAQRVEAVRAVGDDLRHAGLVERGHVLLGKGLEHVFVADPPRRIARAGLTRTEDRELHAGLGQQLGGRLGGSAGPFVKRGRATHPVQVLRGGITRLEHPHADGGRPLRAL